MVHQYLRCGDQSLPVRRKRLCAGGGGGGSPCCASLCATRASAYRRTRYACSFWFAARFAKQSGDVYAESFSPSVLRDVHVHIADNSATDHKFLTTQITSSWGIRRQRRKAAPTLSVSSTIRWIEALIPLPQWEEIPLCQPLLPLAPSRWKRRVNGYARQERPHPHL